jgi:hypothetical protein
VLTSSENLKTTVFESSLLVVSPPSLLQMLHIQNKLWLKILSRHGRSSRNSRRYRFALLRIACVNRRFNELAAMLLYQLIAVDTLESSKLALLNSASVLIRRCSRWSVKCAPRQTDHSFGHGAQLAAATSGPGHR